MGVFTSVGWHMNGCIGTASLVTVLEAAPRVKLRRPQGCAFWVLQTPGNRTYRASTVTTHSCGVAYAAPIDQGTLVLSAGSPVISRWQESRRWAAACFEGQRILAAGHV